jgi:hypothetical protein
MNNPITHLTALRRRQQFKEDLELILETPHGKRFFEAFLRDSNVTRPKFNKDPMETAFNEGKRHLAMSYLNLLGQDDHHNLIHILEQETKNHE